jgi:hypothetical protein
MAKREMHCKYCGATWILTGKLEDLRWYLSCCKPCWDNDEPGMARFNRMAEMMGTTWALHHAGPI